MSHARVVLASLATLLLLAVCAPGANAALLDGGEYHTCSVFSGGVTCVGDNDRGQLGDGTTDDSSAPVNAQLPAGRTATAVAAGRSHSCALLDDGSVSCWGLNQNGQLGDGTADTSATPVAVQLPTGRTARAIAAGDLHTCAILDDGSATCWGYNGDGGLGDGTDTDFSPPVAVQLPAGRTVAAITAGSAHSCAILDDATATCWGANYVGQLGNGTTDDSSTPAAVQLPAGRTVTAITAGQAHVCALLDDGTAACWGSNSYGELGNGTTNGSPTPVAVQIPAGRTATAIVNGGNHSCAILDDDTATCWGLGDEGQLGDGGRDRSTTPVTVELPSGRTATTIAAGRSHTCAVLDDDTISCWGDNQFGQLGVDVAGRSLLPRPVLLPAGSTAAAVTTGTEHTCAVLDGGTAGCWGRNFSGQLGDGTTLSSSTPVDVRLPTGRTVTRISAGLSYSCAILDDGTAACWGDNSFGQLGDGTTTNSFVPGSVQLTAGRTASAISAGSYHSCALLDDGSAACWGYSNRGALGDGTFDDSTTPVPVQLPAGRTATAISAGSYHSCAVLDDGTATCWGDNEYGQLGNAGRNSSSVPIPVQLPAGRTATAITAGSDYSCAILDDGTAACWGRNDYGQLGDGTSLDYFDFDFDPPAPALVQLPAGRTATAITGGLYHTCATLDDDTATCWGANYVGQLGDGTTTQSLTPVPVELPAGRTATGIAAGGVHSCATLDDGSAACWGNGYAGQRGDGKADSSYVPITSSLGDGSANAAAVCTAGAVTVPRNASGVEVGTCSDADRGDALTLTITTAPTNGTAVVDGTRILYTPNAGYTGPDSVTFTADDGTVDSAPATAGITVSRTGGGGGGGGGSTDPGTPAGPGTPTDPGTTPGSGGAPGSESPAGPGTAPGSGTPAGSSGDPAGSSAPPAAAPPSGDTGPTAQPLLAGRAPAKINVRRAAVRNGRLDLLADITRLATGNVRIKVTTAGRTHTTSVPIPKTGILRLDRALPRTMRRARTAMLDITYAGDDTVRHDSVRLRAATGKARLQRTTSTLADGVLTVTGTVGPRARGVVRISLTYVTPAGTPYVANFTAPIVEGHWTLTRTLTDTAVKGGDLVIEYTGHLPTRTRGERLNKLLP